MALSDKLRSAALGLFLSCAGPTLANKEYRLFPQQRQESAYQDTQNILAELCLDFKIDTYGFHCIQQVAGVGFVTSDFRWQEIRGVECQGKMIRIIGEYDSSTIYTHGPVWEDILPQCKDLAEVMQIYIQEREK